MNEEQLMIILGSTPVTVGIEVMLRKGYNTDLTNQSAHLYGQY